MTPEEIQAMTSKERQRIVDEDLTMLRYGLPQKHGIQFGFDFRTIFRTFVKQMRTLKEQGFPRAEYLDAANEFTKQAEGTGFTITFDESVLDMPEPTL